MATATIHQPSIHPLWALAALPAMVLLLLSDGGNNLSIVHQFATGQLSLYSWQALALGCALAAAPLGYAASGSRMYWAPTFVVVALSGFLTLLSTGTDFSSRSASANNYQATTAGLLQERAALLESLNPTDGSLPCKAQRWCDSQAKERRVAEINSQLSQTPVEVDPLQTPMGALFAQVVGWLRAFGVPFLTAVLGNVLGMCFRGGSQAGKKPEAPSYKESSPKYSEDDLKYSEQKEPELSVEKSVKHARKWLEKQEAGRINKTKLKIACKARTKTLQKVIAELIKGGDLKRMSNGQLAKPSKELMLPDNVVRMQQNGSND